ncbi:hypothetical protein GN958_ATG18716 [Phytophthora infestans]|uniref:Uncharacterized protein n=1 Tax=Phytophthora infestans TaxID=4787 RepID=A0A8S9TZJ8_PHYIN|nr:hypothetical protein GN958_ATG18716 [Phytophthora infestans]
MWLSGDRVPRRQGFITVGSRRCDRRENNPIEEPMVAHPQYDMPPVILRRPIGRATGSSQITEAPEARRIEVIVGKVSGTQTARTYVPEDQIDKPTAADGEIATSRFEDVQTSPVSKLGAG